MVKAACFYCVLVNCIQKTVGGRKENAPHEARHYVGLVARAKSTKVLGAQFFARKTAMGQKYPFAGLTIVS